MKNILEIIHQVRPSGQVCRTRFRWPEKENVFAAWRWCGLFMLSEIFLLRRSIISCGRQTTGQELLLRSIGRIQKLKYGPVDPSRGQKEWGGHRNANYLSWYSWMRPSARQGDRLKEKLIGLATDAIGPQSIWWAAQVTRCVIWQLFGLIMGRKHFSSASE